MTIFYFNLYKHYRTLGAQPRFAKRLAIMELSRLQQDLLIYSTE